MADPGILHFEIVNDPVPLGYAGKTDTQVADLLNSLTTNRTLPRTQVPKSEVSKAILYADYPTMNSPDARNWNIFNSLMMSGDPYLDPTASNIITCFQNIFATKTATLNALTALRTRPVSRAEELGQGPVTPGDVQQARAWIP